MNSAKPWADAPRKTIVIFLTAVFCVFASFGFVSDSMALGRQPAPRFAVSVFLSGIFAVGYAMSGIGFRRKWWIAFFPLFFLQTISFSLLGNWLPNGPNLTEYNAANTIHLHNRIIFDGVCVIVSVVLGYVGFVWVSVSEGRRHASMLVEKASLEAEMAAAREIQRVMVPDNIPPIPGYILESVYRPAAQVGGDFFQVIPLKRARTLIVLGDVSGKGLSAAMLVSMLVGMLRTISAFTEEPAEILSTLNRQLCGRMHGGFATCAIVRLEDEGHLTIAHAGHLPPYINAQAVPQSGSLPLGLSDSATYDQTSFAMDAGKRLILLTDGVVEAQDERGVLLGFPRVETLLRQGATPQALADAALHHGQTDDLTILSIEWMAAVPVA